MAIYKLTNHKYIDNITTYPHSIKSYLTISDHTGETWRVKKLDIRALLLAMAHVQYIDEHCIEAIANDHSIPTIKQPSVYFDGKDTLDLNFLKKLVTIIPDYVVPEMLTMEQIIALNDKSPYLLKALLCVPFKHCLQHNFFTVDQFFQFSEKQVKSIKYVDDERYLRPKIAKILERNTRIDSPVASSSTSLNNSPVSSSMSSVASSSTSFQTGKFEDLVSREVREMNACGGFLHVYIEKKLISPKQLNSMCLDKKYIIHALNRRNILDGLVKGDFTITQLCKLSVTHIALLKDNFEGADLRALVNEPQLLEEIYPQSFAKGSFGFYDRLSPIIKQSDVAEEKLLPTAKSGQEQPLTTSLLQQSVLQEEAEPMRDFTAPPLSPDMIPALTVTAQSSSILHSEIKKPSSSGLMAAQSALFFNIDRKKNSSEQASSSTLPQQEERPKIKLVTCNWGHNIKLTLPDNSVLRFNKKSHSPEAWSLSLADPTKATKQCLIRNKSFINELKQAIKQTDLHACIKLLKNNHRKTCNEIAEQISESIQYDNSRSLGFRS